MERRCARQLARGLSARVMATYCENVDVAWLRAGPRTPVKLPLRTICERVDSEPWMPAHRAKRAQSIEVKRGHDRVADGWFFDCRAHTDLLNRSNPGIGGL